MKFLKKIGDAIPDGPAGIAVKAAIGLIVALWWTSGPGADEASDFKAQHANDKGTPYRRHYAFKGRGRKESVRSENKDDTYALEPTQAYAKLS